MSTLRSGSRWYALLCFTTLLSAGCHRRAERSHPGLPEGALAASSGKPIDRLAAGELGAGNAEVWGFVVPRDMQVEHRYQTVTHLVGPVQADALANYVRERVVVSHVEVAAARTTFPNARIIGGAADRVYELEVVPEPGLTRLVIRDTTPPKIQPGLSDADRWRQAGLTPEGRPLDVKAFE